MCVWVGVDVLMTADVIVQMPTYLLHLTLDFIPSVEEVKVLAEPATGAGADTDTDSGTGTGTGTGADTGADTGAVSILRQ